MHINDKLAELKAELDVVGHFYAVDNDAATHWLNVWSYLLGGLLISDGREIVLTQESILIVKRKGNGRDRFLKFAGNIIGFWPDRRNIVTIEKGEISGIHLSLGIGEYHLFIYTDEKVWTFHGIVEGQAGDQGQSKFLSPELIVKLTSFPNFKYTGIAL